ncbi:glycosyltransferase family 2 protein [Halomarina rubra]|uniref:Glycosyltransferase family 2 protein n=1 Tax=Halomarina rubra TaxID=2071873 RepID=A0ABD6AXE2_9EURY|nr:glycosyltransferase family 2 protein [Halomarina rubra]
MAEWWVDGLVVLLWCALAVYGASTLFWVVEVVALGRRHVRPTDVDYGLDEVQVRILTVDAEAVVRGTVAALPDTVDDVHVVAESEMTVPGATVHVVPESFACAASYKGRALEWARRNVPCEREYVLYLDEDTIVTDLHGVPDRDVVQFTELPIYTGSWLTYWCEVFRVGYQTEQCAFGTLRYPLYAWGGGIAVRHELEQQVTWDASTVTEDTSFVWRAAAGEAVSFGVVDARFRNQAPPSVVALVRQRRRWLSGTLGDLASLPLRYKLLANTRTVAWAFSPVVPLLALATLLVPESAPSLGTYALVSALLLSVLFVYTAAGARAYRKRPHVALGLLVLTPLLVVVHAVGALWGVLRPVGTFTVTEKVTPETLEARHPDLDDGALTGHVGTDRLVQADD